MIWLKVRQCLFPQLSHLQVLEISMGSVSTIWVFMLVSLRWERWLRLHAWMCRLEGHVITLADHNLLMVPARDADVEKKNAIFVGRDTEIVV